MEAFFRSVVTGRRRGIGSSLVRAGLTAASVPYRAAVAVRNGMYDARLRPTFRAAVPVISVGNITTGGTGKTPFVEFLCRRLRDRGLSVVILSRGYRARGGRNDEAILLDGNLPDVPHLQGPDRVALAERAIERFRPDVLVLDDGFQHRRLARDLDIVLVDGTDPFGHGLLPRGYLREPVASLQRADLVVLSRANLCSARERARIVARVRTEAGDKPVIYAEHRPVGLASFDGDLAPVAALQGKPVVAFCGIGNPEAFRETLRRLGCRIVATQTFPDHHAYEDKDLESLVACVKKLQPHFVVTTEKDLVKVSAAHLAGRPVCALQVKVAITDPAGALDRALAGVLGDRRRLARAA